MRVLSPPCRSVIYLAITSVACGMCICQTAGILPSNFTTNADSSDAKRLKQLGR